MENTDIQMSLQAQFYSNLCTVDRKARVYNHFARRVFTMSYIQSIQILVLLYLLFSFTICIYSGSGLTFIMTLQFSFFFFFFGSVCQQRDLPLFRCCSGSK